VYICPASSIVSGEGDADNTQRCPPLISKLTTEFHLEVSALSSTTQTQTIHNHTKAWSKIDAESCNSEECTLLAQSLKRAEAVEIRTDLLKLEYNKNRGSSKDECI
jgi:hypothetical protein